MKSLYKILILIILILFGISLILIIFVGYDTENIETREVGHCSENNPLVSIDYIDPSWERECSEKKERISTVEAQISEDRSILYCCGIPKE